MMRRLFTLISVLTFLTGAVPIALAHEPPAPFKLTKVDKLGEILTGPKGMTLYTFDNDKEPGKSTCSGECAKMWPPFTPEASAPAPKAPLSIITRDDGSKQYAYKGKPLYYYVKDSKPGDATGHGVGNRWWAAKP